MKVRLPWPVIGDPCPFLVSVPLPGASDVCVAFADAVPVERHLNGVCGRQARYVPQRAKPKSCPKAIDRLGGRATAPLWSDDCVHKAYLEYRKSNYRFGWRKCGQSRTLRDKRIEVFDELAA